MATRYACPCCGYLTLPEEPPGTFDICPVCGWQDDLVQYEDPDYQGGANLVSLNEAKRNYSEFGAKSRSAIRYGRTPTPEEVPDTMHE